jgi:hypothetical protein
MRTLSFLVLAAFFSISNASAALRGDWQSAGAPISPYEPPYKFLYRCQAELTDQEEKIGQGGEIAKGRPYRLYAVQKFEVTRGKTYTNFAGSWTWIAKMLDANEREGSEVELKRAPMHAFSLAGHSAGLSFGRGSNPEDDHVTLSAYVKLSLGEYYLVGHQSESVNRASRSLEVRAAAYLHREEGQPKATPHTKQRSLYVVCDKVK